jgi:glycosyltransferase involved in cell wall biosynthesis
MTRLPTISVIIPLYNKAAYVERAVQSALSQIPGPDEVLVIDDGSTDDGLARLERFAGDSRVRIVRQKNAGEGAARNRGLSEMRGELAAFLDADDEWLPGHLEGILELSLRFPEAGILATGFRSVGPNGVLVETTVSADGPVLIPNYFEAAGGAYFLHISSCAVRRSASEEAGGFVEGEPLGADLDFYARVALRRPVAYHPAISGLYYAAIAGSAIHAQRWNSHYPPVVRLLRKARAGGSVPPELARSAQEYADWILAEHALTGLCAGYRSGARALLDQVQRRRRAPFRTAELVRLGAGWLPLALLRAFIRWRRSRFSVAGTSGRNGVINRVLYADG